MNNNIFEIDKDFIRKTKTDNKDFDGKCVASFQMSKIINLRENINTKKQKRVYPNREGVKYMFNIEYSVAFIKNDILDTFNENVVKVENNINIPNSVKCIFYVCDKNVLEKKKTW